MHTTQKDTTYTKIFVGGLPYHTTDSSLRKYFEVFGEIEEAVVITDRQTGKSRGYGFVSITSLHFYYVCEHFYALEHRSCRGASLPLPLPLLRRLLLRVAASEAAAAAAFLQSVDVSVLISSPPLYTPSLF